MPEEISIQASWDQFRRDTPGLAEVPPGVLQVLLRDVFFAGAHTATWGLNHYVQQDVSDEEAAAMTKRMYQELDEWAQVFRARYGIKV